jgi:hypothetical protein
VRPSLSPGERGLWAEAGKSPLHYPAKGKRLLHHS